jgi:hypothetical protein
MSEAMLITDRERTDGQRPPGRVDIVVTTIGGGEFLSDYSDLVAGADALDLVRIVVIADRKTPRRLHRAAAKARARGVNIVLPTLAEQEDLLNRLGAPGLVPWNSDNRRNVGYLLAWMSDAEYVISIDDDNLPASGDLLAHHGVVLEPRLRRQLLESPSRWFNPCDALALEQPGPRVFARGFPYSRRQPEPEKTTVGWGEAAVRINAGLWLGDPDVDAVTRLALGPRARSAQAGARVLDSRTWAPVNSQNTALHREALPAYWFVRMGHRIFGSSLDRFGDILSGYFVQACAKHLGHCVRFGSPLTRHARNDHDLLADLAVELPGILVTEQLAEWLPECGLEGSTYAEAYRSLSQALDEAVECGDLLASVPGAKGFIHDTAAAMREWLDLLKRAA